MRRTVPPAEIERLAAATARVCRQAPAVRLAWLYGSALRGEPAADLDVGLLFDEPADAVGAFGVCNDVAAALEAVLAGALPVDVRALNGSGPVLRRDILFEGRLVYAREPDERVVVQAEWMSEWHDFQPFWERQVAAALAAGGQRRRPSISPR